MTKTPTLSEDFAKSFKDHMAELENMLNGNEPQTLEKQIESKLVSLTTDSASYAKAIFAGPLSNGMLDNEYFLDNEDEQVDEQVTNLLKWCGVKKDAQNWNTLQDASEAACQKVVDSVEELLTSQ